MLTSSSFQSTAAHPHTHMAPLMDFFVPVNENFSNRARNNRLMKINSTLGNPFRKCVPKNPSLCLPSPTIFLLSPLKERNDVLRSKISEVKKGRRRRLRAFVTLAALQVHPLIESGFARRNSRRLSEFYLLSPSSEFQKYRYRMMIDFLCLSLPDCPAHSFIFDGLNE